MKYDNIEGAIQVAVNQSAEDGITRYVSGIKGHARGAPPIYHVTRLPTRRDIKVIRAIPRYEITVSDPDDEIDASSKMATIVHRGRGPKALLRDHQAYHESQEKKNTNTFPRISKLIDKWLKL